jgi:undecaprenyl diphosphate synthase
MAVQPDNLPTHLGFIVDGNRRWAKKYGLPAYEGHIAGYNVLKDILFEVYDRGVKYASIFIFSTENWQRPRAEVSKIMSLCLRLLRTDLKYFMQKNVRLLVLGARENLSPRLVKAIENAEAKTAANTGGTLAVCLNYGGQLEITDAVKKIVQSGVAAEEITPDLISQNIYAPEVPPIDLIVRTSDEKRISNFMLWRAAYSELLFLKKLWPEMTKEDVDDILNEYARRQRRFGK